MMRVLNVLCIILALLSWGPRCSAAAGDPAPAESRIALVIGNSHYPREVLRNASNDAEDMAAALGRHGFEVLKVIDGDRSSMLKTLQAFNARIFRTTVVLVFYAGHGIQVDGHNYLIPVDAKLARQEDIAAQTVGLDDILKILIAGKAATNIVILDACRNNPFIQTRALRAGSLQSANGLAQVEAPTDSLIAFSTSPNKFASDGAGRNGLYTQHLLNFLDTPNMRIEDIFKRVRIGVVEDSAGEQVPWESTSLTGDIVLNRVGNVDPAAVAPERSVPPGWVPPTTLQQARAYLMTHPIGDQREPVLDAYALLAAQRPLRVAAEKTFIRECPDCPAMARLYGDEARPDGELLGGAYHVTISQYGHCVSDGGCTRIPVTSTARDALMPMTNVTLEDAQKYVDWLNRHATRYLYRLPTESDWRRAFTSGYAQHGKWVEKTNLCEVANLYDMSGSMIAAFRWQPIGCNDGFPALAPIGSFLPSEDGLFDLIGNVWHWTTTCGVESSPPGGTCKKVKLFGGSWATAKRISVDTPPMLLADHDIASETIGFRVFATRRPGK